ncbi:MAG: minE [Gammaproteobacteria bacterium]|jgi:cell division topological specificity factor|nr:minE [Gammaproteobacteria bacterium]
MNLKNVLDYFRGTPRNTAALAKERLQIIVSHERGGADDKRDFLPQMEKELIAVIGKYFPIDQEQVKVQLAREGDFSVLELNVTLPKK